MTPGPAQVARYGAQYAAHLVGRDTGFGLKHQHIG
jgi:hypothetical protein